ncbi:MAG: type II secretion system secretin GspD [Halofilum sp. (in: g-proteobacteria)]|nr:type II secretion system secretin GspD [Halofilum sp. (in: g-proteobacteria)]
MTATRRPSRGPLGALALSLVLAIVVSAPALAEPFTLNLQNAELRSLIQTVSKRTGRNFIVDPRVNAKITVVSSTPVNDRELYDVFLSVLAVHGYAAVPQGDVTKIVPAVAAKQDAIPSGEAQSGSQLVTRVVTVEHVNAAQLVPILRPLLPQEGHLAAYQPTNRLIVTDSGANIQRIMQIIDRVDRPVESDIDVVRLEHASASEVVRILGQLASQAQQGQDQTGGRARLAADTRTNSVLISGSREERLRMRGLIANLDTPLEREGNTRVMYLKYANAEDMTDILEGVNEAEVSNGDQSGQGGDATSNDDGVVIQADANTNALIMTGPPDRLEGLESIVRQLDIRRAQVLVEAIIAEISQDKARELGVQFVAADTSGDSDTPAALTSFGSGGSNILEIATESALPGSGLTLGGLSEGSSGMDFGVLIRALASDANNNILSTPSLVTLDNEEAEIVVGQNVPFVTGSFSSNQTGGSATNPFQTIERRDVGITLKVKPQINEGDTVKMDIEQEVSSLSSSAQTASDVVTNKRSLKTTVLVQDDQTLVLGGLIDDTIRTTDERVPLLGDIPVLGRLFRYQSTNKVKQNLMVFLHPRILREKGLADYYTGEKYNYMRSEQIDRQRKKQTLMIDELPELPELELRHRDPGLGIGGQDDERDRD